MAAAPPRRRMFSFTVGSTSARSAPLSGPGIRHTTGQQRRAQRRGRRVVGVLVGENLDAAGTRGVDVLNHRRRQPPAVRAERFHVGDDADDVCLLGDANHFVDRRHDAGAVIPFVANMTRIETAKLACDRGERNYLLGPGVTSRCIEETARQPERALLHAAAHEIAHPLELIRLRRAVLIPHNGRTDRTVSDQKRDVRPDTSSLQARTLRREIDTAAPVRIPDDRRHALRQQGQTLS
jgi:hypothetical protein